MAQNVATTGNLKVYLLDTPAATVALANATVDPTGYTKIIDGTITIPAGAGEINIDVPVGGPGTSAFTPTPGNAVTVLFQFDNSILATPLGAPTVFCTSLPAGNTLATYQSQTTQGNAGAFSAFRPETRFGSTICATPTPAATPTPTPNPVCALSEGFDVVAALGLNGWTMTNNSQPGPGSTGWYQGNTAVFPSQSGAPNSYIAADFNNGTGTSDLSNWLLTPPVLLEDGAQLTFWTRTVTTVNFPDRLQVRMSTNGTSSDVGNTSASVGDFTTLLLDINPGLTINWLPERVDSVHRDPERAWLAGKWPSGLPLLCHERRTEWGELRVHWYRHGRLHLHRGDADTHANGYYYATATATATDTPTPTATETATATATATATETQLQRQQPRRRIRQRQRRQRQRQQQLQRRRQHLHPQGLNYFTASRTGLGLQPTTRSIRLTARTAISRTLCR